MQNNKDQAPLLESVANDKASFDTLTAHYHYQLLVHCYRILGSVEDAEDGLQVTLMRAWRRMDQIRDRSALRAWLYKIATNVSLDMLKTRKVRSMPHLTHSSADPQNRLPAPDAEFAWIDPLPDFYLADYSINPEQQHEVLENVSLAFLVVLQQLPGRQRAVLLLRDVLDWKAKEVASALEMTVAAVNSTLQRARANLRQYRNQPVEDPNFEDELDLLTKYVRAWETADIKGLMALIHADAKLTMPPLPVWYYGRSDIQTFFNRSVFAGRKPGDFKLVASRSNGNPAFAVFQRDESGEHRLAALHILTIQNHQIIQLDDFLAVDQSLFSRFNLQSPK
jgi:RNA polymerase sigma-70 factor (ECF subfamily)